jgi:hypothetical protein
LKSYGKRAGMEMFEYLVLFALIFVFIITLLFLAVFLSDDDDSTNSYFDTASQHDCVMVYKKTVDQYYNTTRMMYTGKTWMPIADKNVYQATALDKNHHFCDTCGKYEEHTFEASSTECEVCGYDTSATYDNVIDACEEFSHTLPTSTSTSSSTTTTTTNVR